MEPWLVFSPLRFIFFALLVPIEVPPHLTLRLFDDQGSLCIGLHGIGRTRTQVNLWENASNSTE